MNEPNGQLIVPAVPLPQVSNRSNQLNSQAISASPVFPQIIPNEIIGYVNNNSRLAAGADILSVQVPKGLKGHKIYWYSFVEFTNPPTPATYGLMQGEIVLFNNGNRVMGLPVCLVDDPTFLDGINKSQLSAPQSVTMPGAIPVEGSMTLNLAKASLTSEGISQVQLYPFPVDVEFDLARLDLTLVTNVDTNKFRLFMAVYAY